MQSVMELFGKWRVREGKKLETGRTAQAEYTSLGLIPNILKIKQTNFSFPRKLCIIGMFQWKYKNYAKRSMQ